MDIRESTSCNMSGDFNDDFDATDMDFFYNKCLEYLKRISEKPYVQGTVETWSDQFKNFQNEYKQLQTQLVTAMYIEDTLVAWQDRLWPTYKEMEDILRQLQWEDGNWDAWQLENQNQNQFLYEIKDDIYVLQWIAKEMLRILNPKNSKYRDWLRHSRRDFLVEIGYPKVQPGPPQRIWEPGKKKGDIRPLLWQLKNLN